jgi:broad specificity phosphatase PhoE
LAPTIIYLIRHAHADWSEDDDRPLSQSGATAANVIASHLSVHPIIAIYSSPSRRAVETVAPLSERLGLRPVLKADLRERELPVVSADKFEEIVRDAWHSPNAALIGGESNINAQTRGLGVLQSIRARHVGGLVAVSTHGNLMALMLNGLDSAFGYEFWRRLSFPDIYRVVFENDTLTGVDRLWDPAAPPVQ